MRVSRNSIFHVALGRKKRVGCAGNFIPIVRDFILMILITTHFTPFVPGNRSALFSKFNARQVRSRLIICSAEAHYADALGRDKTLI